MKELKSQLPAELRFDPRLLYVLDTHPGKVLNLGAGVNLIDGATNHDRHLRPGIDVAFDLIQFPWPIKDQEFHVITAFHVLEHIPIQYSLKFFQECSRILDQSGGLIIEVPDFPGMAKEYLEGNVGILGRFYGSYEFPGEGHVWGWDKSQLMYASRLGGFKICITKPGTDYHSGQIPTIRLEAVKH